MKVEGNKRGFTFCDKSGDIILLATPNLWNNIQIVRTYILRHNVFNSISLMTKYLDFETLYYTSDKVMCHIIDNVEDIRKICFPT